MPAYDVHPCIIWLLGAVNFALNARVVTPGIQGEMYVVVFLSVVVVFVIYRHRLDFKFYFDTDKLVQMKCITNGHV